MLRQLSAGIFYATLNQVWKIRNKWFGPVHFDALLRQNCPDVYETTLRNAVDVNNHVATDDLATDIFSNTASGFDYDREEEIHVWPSTDIFGEPGFGEMAHLIPAFPDHASVYDDVATWALGLTRANLAANTDEEFWAAKQKVIHGVKPDGNEGRVADTGLKHSQFNKIRLGNHQQMFNDDACILVVPIMSLDDVKNWNGQQGYDAIVLAEVGLERVHSIARVCTSTGMSMHPRLDIEDTIANDKEVEQARLLLENVLCGLAQSLVSNIHRPDSLNPGIADLLNRSRKVIVNTNIGVTIPLNVGTSHLRVRKVAFGPVGDETQHPAPDPLLLAVKAAVGWSKRHGPQLLVAGERPEEDDIDSVSLDEEEVEEAPAL
jgi:hypothetical protein